MGHLDGVGVPELVGCEPAPDSGGQRGAMQLGTDAGWRAWPPAGRAAQNAEERADRQGPAQLEPGVELLPRPAVHPDLPPATALAGTDQHGAALAVKIGLSQRERLADPQPARQSTMIKPRSLIASGPSPAARITAMISSTGGGSGG